MVTVKCSVCDNIFKVEKYIGGECPACGQEFSASEILIFRIYCDILSSHFFPPYSPCIMR